MSCGEDQREVGAFGDGGVVRYVPCGDDAGGSDERRLIDAEVEDLLGVSPGISDLAAACSSGEGIVRGVSRRAQ